LAIELPNWINDLPENRQTDARRCFLLRLAALHYSEDGHLKALSTGIGLAEGTLATYLSSGQPLTAHLAIRLEEALGRDLFPRELFRPDLFNLPSA
jgi:hypothetical protein